MGFLFTGEEGDNIISKIATKATESFASGLGKILESNFSSEGIKKSMMEMDEIYSRVSKTMGLGRESANAIKTSMVDAYSNVTKMGGSMAEMEAMQTKLSSTLGTNVIASSDYFEQLTAAAKASGQDADVIAEKFLNAGYNMNEIGKETNDILNTARSLGANADVVTKSVLSNMSALDTHNFAGGVTGLAKMASTSASLRVDMSTILSAVDKAFDPQGAIEMAAAFQRLGVSQSELLDPLRLMNMSQNDPEAFQQSIAKMGASLTELDEKGNVRIAPGSIRRMKELATAAGIPQGEFAKMSKAAAELDMKMSKLQFPDFATDEQKTLLANITQMKDGKMQIKVDGEMKDMNEVLKGFKGDEKEFQKFLKDNQPKTNEEILQEQLSFSQEIANNTKAMIGKVGYSIAGTKQGDKIMASERDMKVGILKSFEKELDVSKMRKVIETDLGLFSKSILKMTQGTGTLNDVLETLKTIGMSLGGDLKTGTVGVKNNLIEEANKIQMGDNEYSKIAVNVVDKLIGVLAKSQKIDLGDLSLTQPLEQKPNLNKINGQSTEMSTLSEVGKIDKSNVNVDSTTTVTGDMTLTVKIDAPQNIDTKQLALALNDPDMKAKIVEVILTSKMNNNNTKKY